MLKQLEPINNDEKHPVFFIAGVEWHGYVFLTGGLTEISHRRDDGIQLTIKNRDQASVSLTINKKIAAGVYAERWMRFSSVEEAAAAGLVAEFQCRDEAGVTWHLCREDDEYASWIGAFCDHDKGEISQDKKESSFGFERSIEIAGRIFKAECFGFDLSYCEKPDTRIKTFDEAAEACANVFNTLCLSRGNDAFRNGFDAGREALKREVAAL